jgi:hypothetical protein
MPNPRAEPNAEAIEVAATATGCQVPRASGSHAVDPTPARSKSTRRIEVGEEGDAEVWISRATEWSRGHASDFSKLLAARRRKAPWVQLRMRLFREGACKTALTVRCARRTVYLADPFYRAQVTAWASVTAIPGRDRHGFATRGVRIEQVGVNPPGRAVATVGADSVTERRAAPGL